MYLSEQFGITERVTAAADPPSPLETKETHMDTCSLCRWPTELDDIALGDVSGRFVCLRCFHNIAESAKPLSKKLRRLIEDALAEVDEPAA